MSDHQTTNQPTTPSAPSSMALTETVIDGGALGVVGPRWCEFSNTCLRYVQPGQTRCELHR